MSLRDRTNYIRRVFASYLLPGRSQLTFWHDTPEVNKQMTAGDLGPYYMTFREKANYPGPFDDESIPLLNYHGTIGLQHNPIAIAQYGLGNYNLFKSSGDASRKVKFRHVADWLVRHLEKNAAGIDVWNHHFDWDYRTRLQAPWYSGLAQGQGISLLVRAHAETNEGAYLDYAKKAYESFRRMTNEGGVIHVDKAGNPWIEEYIVEPPTHILNGFLWAAWGIHDYHLATSDEHSSDLFARCCATLKDNLHHYDIRYWSLYEQSGTRLPMVASPFYHSLHITQLDVMYKLTGEETFIEYARRWSDYRESKPRKTLALAHKALFKLCYY